MALRATVYKCELALSHVDGGVYDHFSLTLARHPSETEERLMVRLLAFVLFADAALVFGRGLSTEDEADLYRTDPTGAIDLWIDVGLPDERSVRKACGRASQVVVLAYGRRAMAWWAEQSAALSRLPRLRVLALGDEELSGLLRLASRAMQLSATVHDGQVWLETPGTTLHIAPRHWLPAG